jgi:hypothetical protein
LSDFHIWPPRSGGDGLTYLPQWHRYAPGRVELLGGPDVGDDHVGAFPGAGDGVRPALPASAAGDEGDLAFQHSHG